MNVIGKLAQTAAALWILNVLLMGLDGRSDNSVGDEFPPAATHGDA